MIYILHYQWINRILP